MLKRLAGHSLFYLGGLFLTRALAFLLLPLYTRFLSPADYGILAICSTVSALFGMLATPPMQTAVSLFFFKLNPDEFRKLLGTIWLWTLLVPLAGILGAEACGPALVARIYPSIPWLYLRLSLWIGYLTIISSLPLALFNAEERPSLYVSFNIASFLLTTALLVYWVALRHAGAYGSLIGQLVSASVIAGASHLIILRRSNLHPVWSHLTGSIALCAPFMPHMVFVKALDVADRLILGHFRTMGEVGVYNLAYTVGTIPIVFGTAFIAAYGPLYYKSADDKDFLVKLPRILCGYGLAQSWLTLAIALVAPEVLRVMAAPAYRGGWMLVPWIAVGYWLFTVIYQPCLVVLQNQKRTRWAVLISGLPAAVNITLNWLLIPRFGSTAAAIDTLLAFLLMAVLARTISSRLHHLPFRWAMFIRFGVIAGATYCLGNLVPIGAPLAFALAVKGAMLAAAWILMTFAADFKNSEFLSLVKFRRV